jgi:dTDP-4-amino-4,6-dideoxygalactose transaminase
MNRLGFNYRAADIGCALGVSQLGRLDGFLDRRRALVSRYDQALAARCPRVVPAGRVPHCRPGWHLYVALIDFGGLGITRSQVMESMAEQGIGTQVHYYPVHRQPYYRRLYGDLDLPGSTAYYKQCLSLPLFPSMSDNDIDRVVDALCHALA